jgi:hypothetical protein
MRDDANESGVRLTTEDTNGNGTLELVARFNGPFDSAVGFRVDTENMEQLSMHVDAMAFNTDDMIASASGDAPPLPAGGAASVALTLSQASGPIGPNTRTTDIKSGPADIITVLGHQMNAHLTALAVCDLNGDMVQDIVIGAPDDDDRRMLGGAGAVYVIWGGKGTGTTIDLKQMNAISDEFHFFGASGFDHLGTAVACADFDGDMIDDLAVGAPGANLGKGSVYVVYGQISFDSQKSVDLTSASGGADITFTTAGAGAPTGMTALFGSTLHAADLNGDRRAELLVSAPGTKQVHVFQVGLPPPPGSPVIRDADAADHVVFTGAAVAAIGAGDLDSSPAASGLDVVLGEPTHRESNDTGFRRGAVYLFQNVDPKATASRDVAAADVSVIGQLDGSLLGSAVLIADTSGQGPDLLMGAPGDSGTGVVYLVRHDGGFFLPTTIRTNDTDRVQPINGYEPAGLFGSALAAARAGFSSGIALRLAVGAPAVQRNNRATAGAAYLFKADSQRRFRIYEQVFGGAMGDTLGVAVAGGRLNDDQIGDMVVAAPAATGSSDPGAGAVYVRFGQ